MSTPPEAEGSTLQKRLEQAGEAMELGVRLCIGGLLACLFSGFVWWLASDLWAGVAVILTLLAFPFGFLTGFFWPEVKLLLWLFLKLLWALITDG